MTVFLTPTLKSTIDLLEGKHGNGMCFHRSAALCYDMPNSMLVIGIFKPNIEVVEAEGGKTDGQPFFHCWVEYCGNVLAPTTIERLGGLQPMHRQGYYDINNAYSIRRISRSKLLEIFRRNPEILIQLKFGIAPRKDGLLVDKLMKAAKLSFKLTECDGVIPNV